MARDLKSMPGFLVLSSLLSLGACQDLPPFNFAVQDVEPSRSQVPEDLRSITVTLAHPYERTGPLPAGGHFLVAPMKEALTDAVDHAAIFQDDGPTHVSLSATVLKLTLPSAGLTMRTDMECRYVLIDRSSGDRLAFFKVASWGEVPMDFSWIGAARAREAVNRAVQRNIAGFLKAVEDGPLAHPRNAATRPVLARSGVPSGKAS